MNDVIKVLVNIWWSGNRGGLGKETVTSCQTCHHLWLPCLCFFCSHKSWVFSLAVKYSQSWGTGKMSECSASVRFVSPAFTTLLHPVPLPMYAYMMTLTQQVFSSCSRYKVSMLNEIKSDSRAVVPTAALILFKLHFAYWLSVFIWRKLTFCSHLYWVRSLTLHGIDVLQW